MTVHNSMISCGVKQLYGLHTQEFNPETKKQEKIAFYRVIEEVLSFPSGMLVFSDHVNFNGNTGWEARNHEMKHRGPEFAKWLVDNKLGDVQTVPTALNPNSGHTIQLWVWYPDYGAVQKLITAENKKRAEILNAEHKKRAEIEAKAKKPVETVTMTVTIEDLMRPAARPNTETTPTPPTRKPTSTVTRAQVQKRLIDAREQFVARQAATLEFVRNLNTRTINRRRV